ncbi:MAG: hypothetical protein WA653_23175, partial [Candidatus Sulfotelmatobacter sp.]
MAYALRRLSGRSLTRLKYAAFRDDVAQKKSTDEGNIDTSHSTHIFLVRESNERRLVINMKFLRGYLVVGSLVICYSLQGLAQQNSNAAASGAAQKSVERDGQHDFDFEVGSWKIHLKRRLHPLTGSNTWVEFDGTSVTRKVWDGRSQIEEFETDSSTGHIEGLTLRLYNPESHQWSLYWANSKDGKMFVPQIGEFKNGRGEFYAQDTLNGKMIFVRFIWTNTSSSMPHFEQSFSEDGGKSWEVNWIT